MRYHYDQGTKQTPYERTRGCRYESALVPSGEVVMAKIADADKMRSGKLDSAWVKAVWVGRVDRSNEHLLLTTKNCIRSTVVSRILDVNQASYHAEVQGLSRGKPRKDGSPAQARTTTTIGRQEATRDDPMSGSSDDHLRLTTTQRQM